MKKFFLMALSVFLFSTTASFAGNDDNSNKVANEIEVSIEKAAPTVWQGWARSGSNRVYLKVYSTPGACYSYFAEIYTIKNNEYVKLDEAEVRESPYYKSSGIKYSDSEKYKYYITYEGLKYRFNID